MAMCLICRELQNVFVGYIFFLIYAGCLSEVFKISITIGWMKREKKAFWGETVSHSGRQGLKKKHTN